MELFQTIQDHLPVFLSEKDYAAIDTLIAPEKIKSTLEQDVRLLSSPSGIALKSIITNDPVGISFIALKKLQQLQYDDNFELYDNYIVTKDNKHLLLFITPVYPADNTGKNILMFHSLDSVIDNSEKFLPILKHLISALQQCRRAMHNSCERIHYLRRVSLLSSLYFLLVFISGKKEHRFLYLFRLCLVHCFRWLLFIL